MSKKKIAAIIASLVVIFGLGFAGYRAMSHSTSADSSNIYTTEKHDKSQASDSSEQKAASSSESSANESSAHQASAQSKADTNKNRVSDISGDSRIKSTGSTTASTAGTKATAKKSTTKHKSTTSHATAATCSIAVHGPIKSGNKIVMSSSSATIHEGDTVASVLVRVAKAKHVALSYQGSGGSVYVRGIAGLFEFDKGSGSGWLYAVNGKFPGYSSGKYHVKKGDRIQWLYTVNLGKDRDAPQVSQR